MTDRDLRILDAVITYQSKFRLGQWDIRHDPDSKPSKEALADIVPDLQSLSATLRVSTEVQGARIERVIVHEMMHLVMLDYEQLVNHTVSKWGTVSTGLMDALDTYLERICEQVSEAVTGVPWTASGKMGRKHFRPFIPQTDPEVAHSV